MSDEDRHAEQNPSETRRVAPSPKTARKKAGAKRPGRPAHGEPLKKHMVSTTDGLWRWAMAQGGASSLVRDLLERERIRRNSPYYKNHIAGGPGHLDVETPLGLVTALEYPGRGILILRGDEQTHVLSYLVNNGKWFYILSEPGMHDLLQPQSEQSGAEDDATVKPAGTDGAGEV